VPVNMCCSIAAGRQAQQSIDCHWLAAPECYRSNLQCAGLAHGLLGRDLPAQCLQRLCHSFQAADWRCAHPRVCLDD
jgi:hypothetical protein